MKTTFRPITARIVSYAAAASMVTLFIAMTLAFPPEIRSQFTPDQLLTLIGGLLVIVVILHGIARSRVRVSSENIEILNGYRKHNFEWSAVEKIGFTTGAPWPMLFLKTGERYMLFAIQSVDGDSTKKAVNTLREYLT